MELETDSYDDDEDLDGWCNDIWLSWLSPRNNPRLEPIFTRVGRSLDEILELEIELINSNTEFTPEEWIDRYAKRFRELLTDDPTLTEFQVKHALYLNY